MRMYNQQGRGAVLPLVVLVVLAVAAWYLLKPQPQPLPVPVSEQVTPTVPPVTTPVAEPKDVLTQEPQQDQLVEQAADEGTDVGAETPVAEQPQLPALDESDETVRAAVLALKWKPGLSSLFITDEMIRRFVVQVDNIAQGRLIGEQALFKSLAQDFVARPAGEGYQLDRKNYQRYRPYLDLLSSVPPADVAALYRQFYPLLQSAYQELGYGDAQFDDRLQQAIKVLLQAPEVTDEPALRLPSVHYAFADAELEQLGLAQKQMIRLGQENSVRLKRLLVQYQPLLKRSR